jgi:type VII secretion-associated serine protease mycosin
MAGYPVRVTTGRAVRLTACATVAALGLVVAIFATGRAHAMGTVKPTSAELSAAAATGVAQRWERTPAGAIFPAAIGYTTDLYTKETAARVVIDPADSCATAVDATLRAFARRDGCVAAMRADYADQLLGSVYTIGVLAFPSPARASDFYARIPSGAYPATGLNAFAVPGTPAALFDDGARQASATRLAGPYVVLAVAGYPDGRPATNPDEKRDAVFSPITQLVSAVAAPLARPLTVRCGSAEWACGTYGMLSIAGGANDDRVDGGLQNIPPPPAYAHIRPEELQTLDQIGAPQAWRISRGAGVTVAVLDTGVDATAPDLTGSIVTGPDYIAGVDPAGYRPPMLHGTYIASIIAAHGSGPRDNSGVIGVAPAAKVLSVRVIPDDTEPGLANYDQDPRYADAIDKGIYYAVAHGASVINMSLGSQRPTGHLRAAVAYAVSKGVVVVASAGNNGTPSGTDPYIYPASYPGVIAVAAVTGTGTRAWFSEQNPAVVISAPGVDVLGVGPHNDYADGEGTSPAAAFVSGVVALIRSRYPRLSPALVEQALITSTALRPTGGYSPSTGFGQVNAVSALAAAARLAAIRPSAGLAPGARFASGPASTLGAIQVIRWDGASIDGYTVAAGAGALCCLVAVALLPAAARRRGPLALGPPEEPDASEVGPPEGSDVPEADSPDRSE